LLRFLGGNPRSFIGRESLDYLWNSIGAKKKSPQDEWATTYKNPVGYPAVHMGDPLVLQHKGQYFLYGTIRSPEEGFQYFESTDLVHWLPQKGTAWRRIGGVEDVEFYRHKFYMTYSAKVPGSNTGVRTTGLAVSDAPGGPFRELYFPLFDEGYSAIDSDLFLDSNGSAYLFFSRNGNMPGFDIGCSLYAVALSRTLRPIGKPQQILKPDQPWEMVLEHNHWCLEGPYVIRHNSRYYMTYSANDTFRSGYAIGYAVADNPLGPWVKARENPILKDTPDAGILNPGHNSITHSPDGGELFIVYHSSADPQKVTRDRVVNIDRLVVDSQGHLKVLGPTGEAKPMPSRGH
jgi:beta-xylosidase